MEVWNYKGSYIEHHGIKGQKWGLRRYQNPDGSLTSAGKRRIEYTTLNTGKNTAKTIRNIASKASAVNAPTMSSPKPVGFLAAASAKKVSQQNTLKDSVRKNGGVFATMKAENIHKQSEKAKAVNSFEARLKYKTDTNHIKSIAGGAASLADVGDTAFEEFIEDDKFKSAAEAFSEKIKKQLEKAKALEEKPSIVWENAPKISKLLNTTFSQIKNEINLKKPKQNAHFSKIRSLLGG